ncbi:metallophosphoesterase [Rhodobacteraceae bacterium NNCM2]|nr:metallophosphoesterase [Coraliihabitans acroporae]
MAHSPITSLLPAGDGHQFVFYGDSCSGVPGAPHEATHAAVNRVVARLDPPPEFIVFPGDEIIGLTPDEAALRAQWAHWFGVEMAWLDRARIPLYHSTGNHTVYDAMSARVFAEVMAHLPRNGPPGQGGLSYFVRRGELLLVFVNTLCQSLGGEGHVELDWLAEVLARNGDARWSFVIGHHPAFPVNGYVGTYQRTIGDEYVAPFWQLLREAGVTAYLCSHILAFDVQCHQGVLQITSAGAGTAHRMPEGVEYLHAVQMAVDEAGLRYQVLDDQGTVRERLSWPPPEPRGWRPLSPGVNRTDWAGHDGEIRFLRLKGVAAGRPSGHRQMLLATRDGATGRMPFWLGLAGQDQRLVASLQPFAGRSPHQWLGPPLDAGAPFDIEVMLHGDMGPGGFLWRAAGTKRWTGFAGLSSWGPEKLDWPGEVLAGSADQGDAFQGEGLELSIA